MIKCIQSLFGIINYKIINCQRINPRAVYKELFKRILSPFYLPVLILISLLLILNSKENIKYNKNKYLIYLMGLGMIVLSESLLGYVTDNLFNNSLIITLPIFLILIVYFIFIYKLKLVNRRL